MKIYFISSFLSVILFFSCKKEDTGIAALSLPPKTQSGQNTFGFLLNSAVWRNYGQVCFPFAGGCRENLSGIYSINNGDVYVYADKVLDKNGSWYTNENIELSLSTNFRGLGAYSTLTNDMIEAGYWLSQQGQPDKAYLLSQVAPSFNIRITTIDTVSKIMSGEFSGKLFRRISDTSFATSTTDSIILEEGRFDIKLK